MAAEEADHLAGENEGHDDGDDELDAEGEELLEGLGGIAVRDLVERELRADLPADHDGHEHGAERHHDAFGPAVEEVEPAVVPVKHLGRAEDLRRGEAVGAETVGRDEQRDRGDDDGDDHNDLLAADGLALLGRLVDEVSREHLHQGDGGGDGRDQDQDVEDHAEHAAESAHVVEHVLQRDEQELRAAEGDLVHGEG